MTELLVGADDRTGALEVAGACAQLGVGPVPAGPARQTMPARVRVVDLATRHADPEVAARRAGTLETEPSTYRAHKIDSTLRGQWAAEVVARQGVRGGPVLVVPALPSAGRTCREGIVYDGDRPVAAGPAGQDPRHPVRGSRPADHLRAAGAAAVTELHTVHSLGAWLAEPTSPFAVCDAATDADLAAIGALVVRRPDVLLAGTSGSVAALTACLGALADPPSPPPPVAPVLVVCASLHPAAREQVRVLVAGGAAHGTPGSTSRLERALAHGQAGVLTSPPPAGPVTDATASDVLAGVAAAVRHLVEAAPVGTLVLVGGDTAAAVLGNQTVLVGGLLAPGVAWGRVSPGAPLVMTRSGGFGGPASLASLVWDRLAP